MNKSSKMVTKDSKKGRNSESTNPYEKPPNMSTSQAIKKFLYNKETGAVMGRTASSWGKIGLFYLIFYGVLAALVAICFWGFWQTLDHRIPKWQLDRSLIGTNPGLGFRPMPPLENVESTLIWFKGTQERSYRLWINSLKEFLNKYKKPNSTPGLGAHAKTCSYNDLPSPGEVCTMDVRAWDPCTEENLFGYHTSSPCVFIKLNKIYGWKPEYYNDTKNLPDKMPRNLKAIIGNLSLSNSRELNTVWISCQGENPADQENIGPIRYIPRQGFPGYYYPYMHQEGYRSPLVAVHFERPRPGILINVECKAWARNIKHNRNERMGSVHFELLID